ncbi:MAG: hypothetical protein QGI09_02490 [Dehalococcoidia bacterium]|nr:hypothetical protein [Dehalococcoidia bacterium]
MADRSERAAQLLNRREFMARAPMAMGATATLAAMTRNLPFSSFTTNGANLSSADSIFAPRPGWRLSYWRNRLNQFRLR